MRISDWSSDVCSSDLLEGHGRRPLDASIDLSRTVGWFTTRYPVVLPTPDDTHDVAGWIVAAKEAMRGIPDDGMTYGMLRYGGHAAAMRAEPSVSFNFVGDINQFGGRVLSLARLGAGREPPAHAGRRPLLAFARSETRPLGKACVITG